MQSIKIKKWGNSQGIRIPKNITNQLKIKEDDEFNLIIEEDKIILEKQNEIKSFKDLFKNYTGSYKCYEYDFGKDVGKEIW